MSTHTFLDAELSSLQQLSNASVTDSAQINVILTTAKHRIKSNLTQQVNNWLAIACLLGWCLESLPPDQAKAWTKDMCEGIGVHT
jgi:hypothetical protein